jgi:putative restriction endonuclease
MNLILKNRKLIENNNYIRKADPKVDYWFDFSFKKLNKYLEKFGDNFYLIITGDENQEGDFYAIPFAVVKDIFTDQHLSSDKAGGFRWIGHITSHNLVLRTCKIIRDISVFYGNPNFLNYQAISFNESSAFSDNEVNDYSIENRKIEINSRQKQSVFRKKVMNNFANRCCISTITESNMLRASHIIPWSHRIDSRLDPSNGLCLSVTYDHLFDQGFISFTDSLKVIVTPEYRRFSLPLQKMLEDVNGKQAEHPKIYRISQEYLLYYRENILIATNNSV